MTQSSHGEVLLDLFAGPGDLRVRCRSLDWGSTPLGPASTWPAGLRGAVRLCLNTRTAMAIWAGPEFTLVHNDGYAKVLGDKSVWALGRPAREVWSERWDALEPELLQVRDHGMATRDEDAPFHSSMTPIQEEDGRIVGVLNIFEETALGARARGEAERRQAEFLAILSHELRNPLAPVQNSLYILDRVPPGGVQAQRAKEVIKRQVDQLSRLLDDLLDITRSTHGALQLLRCRLELNELVRRTLEDQRGLLDAADVPVTFERAPHDVFINADGSRAAQVLGNLLQNAAKFTPRGGRVTVSVSTDSSAGEAILRVADTGAGMSEELLPRIFEPFVQADRTLHRPGGGLGLGLALVKAIVEQHGGSVEARSGGLGRGAEFVVRLPLDRAETIEPSPRAVAPAACKRVLVIEDNVDAADSLREFLELEGHEVEVAHDGLDGVAKARAFRPEIVFCDIGLPGMDGYAVARTLRADETLRTAHLVAVSGYALPDDLQRAKEAGFERHLTKPPSLEKLDRILRA
jgi:signal transduction histidine kinase